MSSTIIIALSGGQGAGKSSLKDAILRKVPGATSVKLASIIYEMHGAIRQIALKYGIPMKKKDGKLLQLLGHEWGRAVFGEDVWVRTTKKECASLTEMYDVIVVDDVRYDNELEALYEMGAILVKLDIPEEVRKARIPHTWREGDHASESGVVTWHYWDEVLDDRASIEGMADYLINKYNLGQL